MHRYVYMRVHICIMAAFMIREIKKNGLNRGGQTHVFVQKKYRSISNKGPSGLREWEDSEHLITLSDCYGIIKI